MAESHANTRLEAFCDGVFAIALTLLIIEIKLPLTDIKSTADVWHGLQHLAPAIFAFVLSFVIIFITWVNHHGTLILVRGSSPAFVYGNALLLLTVVVIPFPTGLLGEFVGTDHAAPAVVLYNSVLALQAIGWMALTGTALPLANSDRSASTLRERRTHAYFAFGFYAPLAVAAFRAPPVEAIITTPSGVVWLTISLRSRG